MSKIKSEPKFDFLYDVSFCCSWPLLSSVLEKKSEKDYLKILHRWESPQITTMTI